MAKSPVRSDRFILVPNACRDKLPAVAAAEGDTAKAGVAS
jgi:hypothetical protein